MSTKFTHGSHNSLPTNVKSTSIAILNKVLAEGIDLALLTKQAHWNLKGPRFIAIHLMLDQFRDNLDEHVDTVAERVVQLGGQAVGTVQGVAAATKLAPYPVDATDENVHLAELVERYAQVATAAREGIDQTDEAGDPDSADILTGFSRTLDKSLWFLESHLPARQ